jgi:hypothetical protein
VSLLHALNAKLEALQEERSNSEDAALAGALHVSDTR